VLKALWPHEIRLNSGAADAADNAESNTKVVRIFAKLLERIWEEARFHSTALNLAI
jgi:hypothetical protein